ncbi:hypothetical protein DXA47_14725 [Tyzzerella nexilis]|nr:hypothetical protein DXA47_14725 [[Clostridium] nexile]
MLESIRSILIARTGSPAVSVTNYQAGSIAMLPAYQRLQMDYEASGNYVDQNIAQYEAAMKKFEDKMNDKLADDRKAEGLKQLLAGIVSATVGTALIFATAGAAAPIVFSAAVVGGTSTLYGLSNATEGMNNISLGFSGDGFTMAENPIRDTLFAGNPDLYYTIGNASTMISAMALPMSGILKGATGAAKFKTIAVDGGRILIGNVAEDKVYDAIYQSTDSRILAMLGSNVVEGVLSGNPANSSVSEIGDVARKVDIEELSHTTIFKNSDDIALGEKVLSNVEVNKLDDVAEVVESGSKADVLAQNRANGRVFEQQEFAKFSSKNNNAVEQITVKTSSGVRTRVDAIGLDANGNVVINEFKSSLAAPLTNNQKIAFPEIFESGATVVGKGKGIFTGGYQIPSGTKVTIIRPE